ncbi:hypothetical protein [bacterium endosymbiont of Bathymodiolus sp. 5 South]|jgi:hypothetical protein|uniref:hypothetical protein n=1 Tax=bacterium endosymbiont of Bathymodiolus sp. 5 South TaxID=1181670 RepID=UPI0010B509FC|nr:hypothetical protein [bacterium endosymbiont of Bathymodiolus sp. 5 South]CAC9653107.1 hypothetical protein [uncultured Gammaproteobacteria bacterium]SHN91719.1 hypothetical protein BCLUESOX_2056 [bacterium endosymbiont of Bathymodiolus sp. 5 South]SSC07206.1 hypothetical protein BTURTLESOX_496 [bacterium endosymbiont of Bathymodiolus sp. 5 South]
MEEKKFNNLCSHYKDTFGIHQATIKQRDTLFYRLLVILAVFISSTDMVSSTVSDYINKEISADFISTLLRLLLLGKEISADFISTLLWLLLLGFTTRYYQVVLEIERQYRYLHTLEEKLNSYYPGTKVFTREGKSYLSKYSLFSYCVWLLYTVFFPVFIISFIIIKAKSEINGMKSIEINQIIDFSCCLIITINSILYIYYLHESSIQNIKNRCTGLITRWRS